MGEKKSLMRIYSCIPFLHTNLRFKFILTVWSRNSRSKINLQQTWHTGTLNKASAMLTRSYWISREKDHIIIIYNVIIYNIYNLTIYNLKAACEEISYHEKASAKTPNSTNRLLGTLDIFFFFFGRNVWHVESYFPDQGSNPYPRQ